MVAVVAEGAGVIVEGTVGVVVGVGVIVGGEVVAHAASAAPSGGLVVVDVMPPWAGSQNRSAPVPTHLPLASACVGEREVALIMQHERPLLVVSFGFARLLVRVSGAVRSLCADGIKFCSGMPPRWPHQPALSAA